MNRTPLPEDGDRPDGPMDDSQNADPPRGPDDVTDPADPRQGTGRPPSVPGQHAPATQVENDPSTGGQSGADRPRGDEPKQP